MQGIRQFRSKIKVLVKTRKDNSLKMTLLPINLLKLKDKGAGYGSYYQIGIRSRHCLSLREWRNTMLDDLYLFSQLLPALDTTQSDSLSQVFEYFILFVIFVNSIILSLYNYQDQDSLTKKNQILNIIGTVLTAIFVAECVLKIIGMGLILHKNSYLRDGWNIIDFIVVVTGVMELALGSASLKSLRILRVFRPLRSIKAVPSNLFLVKFQLGMKRQVGALIKALPYFGNVGLFLLFMLLLFSILGLYQYNGVIYNRCRLNPTPETNISWAMNETEIRVCSQNKMGRFQCSINETCGNPSDFDLKIRYDNVRNNAQIQYGILRFDNLGTSLLTVFNIIITNEWIPLFYNLMDADIPAISLIFHWIIIIFGSFFMLNLILAVIIQAFIDFQKQKTLDELEDLNIKQKNEEIQRQEQIKVAEGINENSQQPSNMNLIRGEQQDDGQNLEDQQQEANSEINQEAYLQKQLDKLNKEIEETNFNYLKYESRTKKVIKAFKDINERSQNEFQLPQVKSLKQLLDKQQSNDQNPKQKWLKERIFFLMGRNIKQKFSQSLFDDQKRQLSCANNFSQLTYVRAEMKRLKHAPPDIMNDPEIKQFFRAEKNIFFNICYIIQRNPIFQMFIQLIIIANTIVLSLDRYPIRDSELLILNVLNGIFTVIFVLEMAIKICGIGFKYYFEDRFNIFDFIVVLLSLLDLCLTYTLSGQGGGSKKGLSALRAFRLLRVFKLAKHWSSFQLVLKAVTRSMKEVGSFSILLALFIYIYTLLGLELFANKAKFSPEDTIDMENGESPTFNFDTFFSSLITVFVVLTNDGWSSIYFSYYRTTGAPISSIFFLTLVIIGQKIMLNLFLATLLKNFDQESFDQLEKEHEAQQQKSALSKDPDQELEQTRFQKFKLRVQSNIAKLRKFINLKIAKTGKNQKLETNKVNDEKQSFSFFYKEDVIENTSLYLFTETNRLRLFIFKIIGNGKFEILVQLVILLSGVHLALENPLNDPNGNIAKALFVIDIITTVFFTVEMLMKILTFGLLLNGEFSYLRNSWNILDFFIVAFSVKFLCLFLLASSCEQQPELKNLQNVQNSTSTAHNKQK